MWVKFDGEEGGGMEEGSRLSGLILFWCFSFVLFFVFCFFFFNNFLSFSPISKKKKKKKKIDSQNISIPSLYARPESSQLKVFELFCSKGGMSSVAHQVFTLAMSRCNEQLSQNRIISEQHMLILRWLSRMSLQTHLFEALSTGSSSYTPPCPPSPLFPSSFSKTQIFAASSSHSLTLPAKGSPSKTPPPTAKLVRKLRGKTTTSQKDEPKMVKNDNQKPSSSRKPRGRTSSKLSKRNLGLASFSAPSHPPVGGGSSSSSSSSGGGSGFGSGSSGASSRSSSPASSSPSTPSASASASVSVRSSLSSSFSSPSKSFASSSCSSSSLSSLPLYNSRSLLVLLRLASFYSSPPHEALLRSPWSVESLMEMVDQSLVGFVEENPTCLTKIVELGILDLVLEQLSDVSRIGGRKEGQGKCKGKGKGKEAEEKGKEKTGSRGFSPSIVNFFHISKSNQVAKKASSPSSSSSSVSSSSPSSPSSSSSSSAHPPQFWASGTGYGHDGGGPPPLSF